MSTVPRVSVVVLAYGAEALLVECVHAILDSQGIDVDVVLVDNGCTTSAVDALVGTPGVQIVRPGRNTGFTGGCNLGVGHATAPIVALVNSDAVVGPGALAALADVVTDPTVGLATSSLRLYQQPETMNSAGNPVHYLGLSWAGGLGDPAADHEQQQDVTGASGAAVAVRRETWDRLGGFWEEMFAYHEDVELSLRCWQLGLRVVFVPTAVVRHYYEFSRNSLKFYLAERNRLLVLLTLYERRTLALLMPALLGLELVGLAVSLRQGWWRQKVRGWWWVGRHAGDVRRRRVLVQCSRSCPDRALAPLLTADFAPGEDAGISSPALLTALSRVYWAVARRLL
jgi:GT2 family glycosyltransferase